MRGSVPDHRRPVEPVEELGHEPRLADSRGSENREQLTGLVRRDVGERLFQQMPLALPADHPTRMNSCRWPLADRHEPEGWERR